MTGPGPEVEPFEAAASALPPVRGFLHRPPHPTGDGLVLTHGASGDCDSRLLVDLAAAFADLGFAVLRCDLPYRQQRRAGPPSPAGAERDRAGLRHALEALSRVAARRRFLGGQSYGGRQASMLVAAEHDVAAGLLLLSYPLHPPARPDDRRTAHLPGIRIPTVFVHGGQDPFGSIEGIEAARALIGAPTALVLAAGGHDLGYGRRTGRTGDLVARIVTAFTRLMG